jgi:hypothetical protein
MAGLRKLDDPHDKEKGAGQQPPGFFQPVSGSNARLSLVVRLPNAEVFFLRGQILARARDEESEV